MEGSEWVYEAFGRECCVCAEATTREESEAGEDLNRSEPACRVGEHYPDVIRHDEQMLNLLRALSI